MGKATGKTEQNSGQCLAAMATQWAEDRRE